jgi:HK97 family phage major capsid protein
MEKEFTMTELEAMIAKVAMASTAGEFATLRQELNDKTKNAIYPDGDGKFVETHTKSVIDTSFFTKSYRSKDGREYDGKELAQSFQHGNGPWVKLSPAMERFAEVLRCGGDPIRMIGKGLDLKAYNDQIQAEQKDVAVGLTTTDVGAIVPIEFLATIVEFATAQSAIIPKVWRVPMGSLTLRIPRLTQAAGSYFGGVTLYHPEEAELKQESKPSFDYLTFTAKKMIGIIPLSDEVVMDSAVAIVNYVTGLFTRAFQYKIEGEIISGTGLTGQMTGILTDTGINLVPRQTVGTVKYDDLINLESSLDENFNNLTFLSRRATVNVFRKQKDSVGQPVYHDGFTTFLGGAMTPQLLGYPVIKSRNLPALGTQGDLILGDLGFYIWALRQDMTIDTSKDARFFYDQTVVRFVMRMDGQPGVSIAFAALDNVPES